MIIFQRQHHQVAQQQEQRKISMHQYHNAIMKETDRTRFYKDLNELAVLCTVYMDNSGLSITVDGSPTRVTQAYFGAKSTRYIYR